MQRFGGTLLWSGSTLSSAFPGRLSGAVVSLNSLDEIGGRLRVVAISIEPIMLKERLQMNWETLYCPNYQCQYYGILFHKGQMVKNGSSCGQKQGLCKACGSSVSLRYGTAYYNLDADPTIFNMAVRVLAEENSLRATGRIVQIDKDTACDWLNRAARHCRPSHLSVKRLIPVLSNVIISPSDNLIAV